MADQALVPKRRSRRIYWLWGIALTLLLGGGAFGLLVVAPVWRLCRIVDEHACMDVYEVPTNPLQARTGDAEDDERAAKYTIGRLGGTQRAVESLRRYLRLPLWMAPHRKEALYVLTVCWEPAVPVLLEAMEHSDPEVREEAAGCLGSMFWHAKLYKRKLGHREEVAKAMVKALQYPVPGVRLAAAVSLEETRVKSPGVTAALAASLKDEDARVRAEAAHSLWALTGETRNAMPVLLKCLNDPESLVRGLAIYRLGDMGPAAAEAVPAMMALYRRKGQARKVRVSLMNALGRTGDPRAEAFLRSLLKSEDLITRFSAEDALKKLEHARKKGAPK